MKKFLYLTVMSIIFVLFASRSYGGVDPIFSPNGDFMDRLTHMVSEEDVKTIDISIYSLGSGKSNPLVDSLVAAKLKKPSLEVRMIFDKSHAKRATTLVNLLESNGIDVRTVTKINHHKFMIVNGVHCKLEANGSCLEDVFKTRIIAGSGNFNIYAEKNDEVSIYIDESPKLAREYSLAFAWLWNHSKDVGQELLPAKLQTANCVVYDKQLTEGEKTLFTHQNFFPHEKRVGSFKKSGRKVVSEEIVKLIMDAKHSVKIAQAHFRMKDIAKALIERSKDPNFQIYIYLDSQNFQSKYWLKKQKDKLDQCEGEKKCGDTGIDWYWPILFPNGIDAEKKANVHVRFKYYMFRWNYKFAPQMHSKYLIVDDEIVVSGSYNYSMNSETNSFEDVVIINKQHAPYWDGAVADFVENFNSMWGRNRGLINEVYERVNDGAEMWPDIPVSMTYKEASNLSRYFWTNRKK